MPHAAWDALRYASMGPRHTCPRPQNAVVFSGFGCAHRALVDLGIEEGLPHVGDVDVDAAYNRLLAQLRDST